MAGMYSPKAMALAVARGYDDEAHQAALRARDQDAIALTHPSNWLQEAEVEALLSPHAWETDDPRGAPPLGHPLPCKSCGLPRGASIHQAKA